MKTELRLMATSLIWATQLFFFGSCVPEIEKSECYQDRDCQHLGHNFICDMNAGKCRETMGTDGAIPADAESHEPRCRGDELLCDGRCIDPHTDRFHCGACAHECGLGEHCANSICSLTCGGDTPQLCGERCVDPTTDRLHCGECDHKCPSGQICSDGTCNLSCGGDTPLLCGERCVDPTTDRLHCGGCDQQCPSGQMCSDGTCNLSCGGDTPLLCGERCVDPTTDRLHCGDCFHPCPPGEFCSLDEGTLEGSCKPTCGPVTPDICGDQCVELDNNNSHCGQCFQSCSEDEVCCSGACANLAYQSEHCGGCNILCPAATPNCCNRQCIDGATDLENCGECHHSCPFRNNANRTCEGGTCGYTCNLGYDNCDENHNSGCESNLLTDRLHCGRCGRECPPGTVCANGECELTCGGDTPLQCGNRCVDPLTDPLHCGACNQTCTHILACREGVCLDLYPIDHHQPTSLNPPSEAKCTTVNNRIRTVSMDEDHNLYAVMRCENNAYVVVNRLNGDGWSAPFHLPLVADSLLAVAVSGGPESTAYVVAYELADVTLFRSTDGGQSWDAPIILAHNLPTLSNTAIRWEGHIVTHGDSVYTSARAGGTLHVWSNHNRGQGQFNHATIPFGYGYSALLPDQTNGNLWLMGESSRIYSTFSTDGGLSFGPIQGPHRLNNADVNLHYAKWVAGTNSLFGFGRNVPSILRFSLAEGVPEEWIPNMAVTPNTTLCGDSSGNIYMTENLSSSLTIGRVFAEPPFELGPVRVVQTPSTPLHTSILVSLETGITAAIYTIGDNVWLWASL